MLPFSCSKFTTLIELNLPSFNLFKRDIDGRETPAKTIYNSVMRCIVTKKHIA